MKTKINVINGLFNQPAVGIGIHPGPDRQHALGRCRCRRAPIVKAGISMDQVLAKHVGQETPQPSMVLGCEQPITGYHETNFSMAYSSHISWQNADSPVPMEVYPSLAFDSLFDNRGSLRNQSILDRVKDHADSLSAQGQLRATRCKLDEYLTSVREVEKRIERMRARQGQGRRSGRRLRQRAVFTMERPDNGLPEDLREHMRLMCDIIALAFQTDKTRVATLLLAPRSVGACSIRSSTSAKATTRRSHDDLSDGYERISRFHVSQFAYLAEQARRDARGRRHGARQLLPDVPLEHVVRQQARQHEGAGGARPAAWAARSKPAASLDYLRRRRRQPQAVQPVPVDHGSHGREARSLRRRGHAAAGAVKRYLSGDSLCDE